MSFSICEWCYKNLTSSSGAEPSKTEKKKKFKHSQVLNPHQKKYSRPSMLDKVILITDIKWNIAWVCRCGMLCSNVKELIVQM